MDTPRFAVDRMLGRLAVWLRLLGFDTIYERQWSGSTLVRHAGLDGRVVLTRDRRLLRRRDDVAKVLVQSDQFRQQLRQVLLTLHVVHIPGLGSRCSRCNEPLARAERAAVRTRVPPYVFATHVHYVECLRCRRIYWPATHLAHMRSELQTIGIQIDPSRTG